MDLNHKCDFKKTYFYESAEEVADKNLSMVKNLSLSIMIIGLAVIAMALTFFNSPLLAMIYVLIISIEMAAFAGACIIKKHKNNIAASNILSAVYLMHMLIIGAIIGTVFSRNESALVYVVVLVISQMLFILPPVLTTCIALFSMIFTFIVSYHVKAIIFFKSDIINCVGVFLLSILIGWRIIKIRIEEAEARKKAIGLSMELKKLSLIDQLTNLQNHRSFQDTYYKMFKAAKSSQEHIGIIMIDIDKFKLYNDGYGHISGDNCLSSIGKCFGELQTEDIIPFRFGGEEFVVIVKDKECDRIYKIAEQFRSAVESMEVVHEFSKVSNVVTISVGYYVGLPSEISMPTQLMDYADQALYASKRAGGNTTSCG